MLQDVQERLVYRTSVYIRTDITGRKPNWNHVFYIDFLFEHYVILILDLIRNNDIILRI